MRRNVRILVLGDHGVGKSSMIHTFISRQFPLEVPPVLTESIIPPERTASDVTVTITDSRIDSSLKPGDQEVLCHKIIAADVILALYDVSNLETLDSLHNYWLPWIKDYVDQESGQCKPVIVVAHKEDLAPESEEERKKLKALLTDFSMVLSAYRCSSLKFTPLSESRIDVIFYMATLFVTCPFNVLYDIDTSNLTQDCVRAFTHIFRIFDLDGDGLLSDYELCTIQQKCFDNIMSGDDIKKWKNQIRQLSDDCVNEEEKVTLKGFLCAMKQYIDMYSLHTPWTILRRFNYNDDLTLDVPIKKIKIDSDQFYELSHSAIEFLQKLVSSSLVDKKGVPMLNSLSKTAGESELKIDFNNLNNTNSVENWASEADRLNWKAVQNALSVLDPSVLNPWRGPPVFEDFDSLEDSTSDDENETKSEYALTSNGVFHSFLLTGFNQNSCNLHDWILHWHMLAMYRPVFTQELLYRLGFVERGGDFGIVGSPKKHDSKKRTVLKCAILGKDSELKTSFFNSLSLANGLDGNEAMFVKKMDQSYTMANFTAAFLKSFDIQLSNSLGKAEVLVSSIIAENSVENFIKDHGASCDATILIVDLNSPESLDLAKNINKSLSSNSPRLFVSIGYNVEASKYLDVYLEEFGLKALKLSTVDASSMQMAAKMLCRTIEYPKQAVPKNNNIFRIIQNNGISNSLKPYSWNIFTSLAISSLSLTGMWVFKSQLSTIIFRSTGFDAVSLVQSFEAWAFNQISIFASYLTRMVPHFRRITNK